MENDLWSAIIIGDADRLRKIVGSAPDPVSFVRSVHVMGQSALHFAVFRSTPSAPVVRVLLEAGADPNGAHIVKWPRVPNEIALDLPPELEQFKETIQNPGASPPCQISTFGTALGTGDLEIARAFVEHGADPLGVDASGYTAVCHAVGGADDAKSVVEYLLQLGASPNGASVCGETPIVQAMRRDRFDIIATLIDYGVDETPTGWTPLIRAVVTSRWEDFEAALSASPDLEARDALDQTALHIALRRGDLDMGLELLDAGAQLDASCLRHAAFGGRIEFVARIVEAGHDINEADEYGNTPLAAAVDRGHTDIVNWLLENGAALTVERWGDPLLQRAPS